MDLNNKIVVEYNELLAEDEELSEFIAYLKEKINEDVGEILAEVEQPAQEENPADTENADAETSADTAQNVVKTVRTTDVVNIRKSDSEEADKIDKAQIGQEFTLLEERGNGWSKIQYNGGEAFIKSDYLEVVDEEIIETTGTEQRPEESSEQAASSNENANESTSGTVKVIESVRVRKSAGTDGEVLGTVYAGTELDLIMKQADGWTKVKYKGQTAYVKSEYVE